MFWFWFWFRYVLFCFFLCIVSWLDVDKESIVELDRTNMDMNEKNRECKNVMWNE